MELGSFVSAYNANFIVFNNRKHVKKGHMK